MRLKPRQRHSLIDLCFQAFRDCHTAHLG